MTKKFRSLNWNSFGFASTMILIGILNLVLGFGTYKLYMTYGLNSLTFFMTALCLGVPVSILLHSYSRVYIKNDTLIKESIFRTKKIKLSDFKRIIITENIPSQIPTVLEVTHKDFSTKWWSNIFVFKHIVLSRHHEFNPYDFRNFKKVTTLPYYDELFDILSEKI